MKEFMGMKGFYSRVKKFKDFDGGVKTKAKKFKVFLLL